MKSKTLSLEEVSEHSIGFRVPPKLMKALRHRAHQEGRSVSDVIRRILAESLNVQTEELSVRLVRRER